MKKELRLHHVRVMVTASELEQLRDYAARERMTISGAIRRIALLAAERWASVEVEKQASEA